MNKKLSKEKSARTTDDSSTKDEEMQVSHAIAKPHVVGSPSQHHLKFRAWDDEFKGFLYFDLKETKYPPISFWKSVFKYKMPVQQYIGLEDRKRIQIYAGDFVIANSSKSVIIHDYSEARKYVNPNIRDERKFIQLRSRFLVYWQNSFSQFSFMSIEKEKCSIDNDVSERNIEIIGNIYVTPELLEGVQ